MPAATPADPVPSQRHQPHLEMLPKLTFTDGEYTVPREWVYWDWINDPAHYPDPDHLVFEDEYDWEYRDGNGVLGRYIRHISGHSYDKISKNGKRFTQTTPPNPVTYYLFALAAVELIETPDLYRDAHAGVLNGQFVVNYANSLYCNNLAWLPEKEDRKKHLIPAGYGALLSRVFNKTSGVRKEDELKLEPREPKKCLCPNCKTIFEYVTRNMVLPGDENYDKAFSKMSKQMEYRNQRDEDG